MDWLVRLSTGKAETETEIETAVADGYADGDAQRWSIELEDKGIVGFWRAGESGGL